MDTKKTMEWNSRFFDAHVINYDGRDTPNAHHPYPPARFPHLITPKTVESIIRTNREDSFLTYMFAYGKPNRMLADKRVITPLICDQGNAFDIAFWKGGGRQMAAGLDPAYGGGDECVFIPGEWGEDVEGVRILKVYPPEVIPISVTVFKEADDQIASWVQNRTKELNTPPQNVFYGGFGKGTLGYAFSKLFGSLSPVPIDEGGAPTKRAVRDGEFVVEVDGTKRPKRCDEHYDRRISQLWYDTRLVIESQQMRELPRDVAEEGYMRIFSMVKGNKVSVETKDDLKKRMQGQSPNKFDALTFLVAGALLRGFRIARLGGDKSELDLTEKYRWMEEMANERWKIKGAKMLHVN